MSGAVSLEVADLHWLPGGDPDHDLCAHGRLVVRVGSAVLVDQADLAVSTGALHLLRSLTEDHTPSAPLAEHLVPHCGHVMHLDASGRLTNLGCGIGVDWWVRQEPGSVRLLFADGTEVVVTDVHWRRAVVGVADAVAAFYRASPPRRPCTEEDAAWYAVFRHEWERRRADAARLD